MQWLLNFNQSFYYTRLAYPQNFIICGSQKLKIWFQQVCMHSKTHLKFQFNSSINSTTSAHIIFFLNTRPHCDPNKIGSTQFGSTNLEIWNLQNNIQNWKFELSYVTGSHWRVGPGCQPDPLVSETKQGRRMRRRGTRWSSPMVTPPAKWTAPTCSPRSPTSIDPLSLDPSGP